MLGRQGSLSILNRFTERHIKDIKKVDIDIFKSGKTKNMVRNYKAVPGTNLSMLFPVTIQFMDRTHLLIRFKIDINFEEQPISRILLDDEKEVLFQNVINKNERYVLTTAYPDEPGRHLLVIELENGKVQNYEFFILHRDLERGSTVDLPIVSYRDSLLNVTKLWLLSSRFDRVRHVDWAGFFDDRCRRYQMSNDGAKQLEDDLIKAINTKIKDVIITDVTAKPLLEERGWDVSVVSTDLTTQISLNSIKDTNDATVKITETENIINHEE